MSSPPPRRFDPCAKSRGGEWAGEWRGLDMHIKLLTRIPRDRAGNLQPAEFPFFSLISLGEIIQQSLTRLFLQINNAINWIYSTHLTPDVLCIRLPLLRWNVLAFECLSGVRLASGGGWRINLTFGFGLRRWQCEFQLPASAIIERNWWRKSHWKTFTRLWECALKVHFLSHNYSLINH